MRHQVRFSKRAVTQMDHVLAHTLEVFGTSKHDEYKQLIRNSIRDLLINPRAWPAKHHPELEPDLFTMHISRRGKPARHLFLYRIRSEVVHISQFLHDAMDLTKHLDD